MLFLSLTVHRFFILKILFCLCHWFTVTLPFFILLNVQMCFKIHCLIVNHCNGLWRVIIKHLHVSRSLFWCFSAAGLLLWIGRLLPVLRLLSQDQTVHLDTLHVRPLLHAGHGDLCYHDVTHCGDGNARTCKSLFRASKFAFFSIRFPHI